MKEELAVLETHLKRIGAPVISYLLNRLGEQQINDFFRNYFPLSEIPQEIIDLYSWHNGTEINYKEPAIKFCLFPDFIFCALSQAKSIYEYDTEIFRFIERQHVILFLNGHGEYLSMYIGEGRDYGKIFYCSTWNPELELYTSIYENAETMLRTVNRCFDTGFYFLDENGWPDMSFEENWKLSKKLNPTSKYWQR